jgi:gamma-glutamyltranspeptidase/glutathione hydrolase
VTHLRQDASTTRPPASVAGGHRETTATGRHVLETGGNAADAAVAMVLVACVAETVFTGIAGGGFAIYFDAASSTVSCLDFFVTVPGLDGRKSAQPPSLTIDFGGQPVQYAYGPATVAVPGLPAGVEHLHGRWGSLPWRDVVEPAATLATEGSSFSAEHSAVLDTIAPAMLLGDGAAAYAPDGRYLVGGEKLRHPGLDHTLRILRDEGSGPFYDGPIAAAIADAVGSDGPLGAEDLRAYQVHESEPRVVEFAGHRVHSRGDDIDDLLGTLVALGDVEADRGALARRLVQVLRAVPRRAETTNVAAVDRYGNACAVTTSLGLASGVWLADYGLHLNSMLGESELIRGVAAPGTRLGSMMSPLTVLDDDGLRLVAGAAGGSRIRSALVQVLLHVLVEDMPLTAAIGAARLNPVPGLVHAEPGLPEEVLAALDGERVSVRAARDAYFGGVSGIDRDGPGADPRRGGHAELARP